MTLLLALQATAVLALAVPLSRVGPPSGGRAAATSAFALVAALPLLTFAPRWSAPAAAPAAWIDAAAALQEPSLAAARAAPAPPGGSPADVARALWLAGALAAAARLGADLRATRRLQASARDRRGDVARSDLIEVPVAIGVLDPCVLLPAAADAWPEPRRALAIAHERAHLRHRDNAWLLLARAVACAHWFNPLAWRAVAALRDACERAADEAVLEGGADPADYADTLLSLARRPAPRAALAMAGRAGLERRVRAVLGDRPRDRLATRAGPAALVLALGIGAATAAPPPAAEVVDAHPGGIDAVLDAEADRLMAAWRPEGVALIVLDARTGAVLGQADRGGLLDRPVVPGSVIKPFTVAAALEAGVPTDAAFPGGDMADVLTRSLNPGAAAIGARAGRPALDDLLRRVGLTAPASLPLDRLAIGDGLLVTPAAVARAWVHLAGHGAIDPSVAAQVRELLAGVVERPDGTGRRAAVPGARIAGKTGTAQLVGADGVVDPARHLASFVGLAPADDPDRVVLVAVAGPRGEDTWGGAVAAPAFARILQALR